MGAAGVAGISPSRVCRLFWHGCSRLPKHVVLSFWMSLRVSKRTKSPGQTAHVISAQHAPSTLPRARAPAPCACVRSAHARTRIHARLARHARRARRARMRACRAVAARAGEGCIHVTLFFTGERKSHHLLHDRVITTNDWSSVCNVKRLFLDSVDNLSDVALKKSMTISLILSRCCFAVLF